MGVRGEVFSEKIFIGRAGLAYYLNVKKNCFGDLYLNIVESPKGEDGSFKRYSLIVFQEDLSLFKEAFNRASRALVGKNLSYSEEISTGSGRRKYSFSIGKGAGGLLLSINEKKKETDASLRNVSIRVASTELERFQTALMRVTSLLQAHVSETR